MATIQVPKTTFSITSQKFETANAAQKVLIIGQKFSGTAASGQLVENIQNQGQEDSLFGSHSILAATIRQFKNINQLVSVDAIGLDDAEGSIAAEGRVIFNGNVLSETSLSINIQSRILHNFTLSFVAGDTAADIGTALYNAINADTTISVFAQNPNPGEVRFVAINKGTISNSIGAELESLPDGINTTSFGSLGSLVAGSGDPDLSNVFDVVGTTRYQTILWMYPDQPNILADFLETRFNVDNNVIDGIGVITAKDNINNLITLSNSINSAPIILIGNKPINTVTSLGSAIFEFEPIISAQFCAVRTLRLTLGSNISQYLSGAGLQSAFGGPALAAIPYHNTPFVNLPVVLNNLGWTRDEQDRLNNFGVSFLGNDTSRNRIIAGDMLTTAANNTDTFVNSTFKFLNYVDTASNIREYFWNRNNTEYAQSILTNGDLIPGIKMANVESIALFQSDVYSDLAGTDESGIVWNLTQSGPEAQEFFKDNLKVTINIGTGIVTITALVPIVTQLRLLNGIVEIVFDLTTAG